MSFMQKVVEFAVSKVGCGYIFGATGWTCTLARRRQQANQYPEYADKILGIGAKWDGKQCYDCAQLTRWAADAAGGFLPSGANSQWKGNYWSQWGPIAEMPDEPCFLYRRDKNGVAQHTGIYIGGGWVVEARGTAEGVIRSRLDSYPWTDYAIHIMTGKTVVRHEDMTPPYQAVVKTKYGKGISLWESSAKARKVADVPEGTAIAITGRMAADGFLPTTYGGKAGVTDSQYSLPVAAEGGPEPEPEPTPTPDPTPGYIVEISGYNGNLLTLEQAVAVVDEYAGTGYAVVARMVGEANG